MTRQNANSVDENLLRELGLGKPTLQGDDWNLTDLDLNGEQPPDDFLETLDALKLLHDLAAIQNAEPPELEPPKTDPNRNELAELLELLETEQPQDQETEDRQGDKNVPELEKPKKRKKH